MAILSFTPSYTSVVIWDKDRLLLRRETQQVGLGEGRLRALQEDDAKGA